MGCDPAFRKLGLSVSLPTLPLTLPGGPRGQVDGGLFGAFYMHVLIRFSTIALKGWPYHHAHFTEEETDA